MREAVTRTQAWLQQPERSQGWALRTIIWIALKIGRPVARALLYPISLYFLVFSVRSRQASASYLARVLGHRPSFGQQFRHYHTFAATILDRVFLLSGRGNELEFTLHGEPYVRDLYERRQGCLLLGAHLGSFEILRAVAWSKPNLRLYFAMYEDNAQKIRAALGALNPTIGKYVIPIGQPDNMLCVRERIEEGAFVGFLADRLPGDEPSMTRTFLGGDARFPVGPFRLAAVLGCPVLTMFGVYRGERRYDVYFETLAEANGLAREDRDAWIADAITRYAQRLEERCRDAPYNWFNFYEFWDRAAK
jgi:predicted LPLAT superfamily acyltransferase